MVKSAEQSAGTGTVAGLNGYLAHCSTQVSTAIFAFLAAINCLSQLVAMNGWVAATIGLGGLSKNEIYVSVNLKR